MRQTNKSDGVFIEEAAAFVMNGQICSLTSDLSGHGTGGDRTVVHEKIWKRKRCQCSN